MKNPPQDSQAMSLLSAYLSGSTGEKPKVLSIRRTPSIRRSSENSSTPQDCPCHPRETSEPPESLRHVKHTNAATSLEDEQIRHLSTLHDLAASPLTSCSYTTLTKEYNMDTWRMYERIQTARSHSEKELLSIVQEAVGRMEYDSTGDAGNQEWMVDPVAYDTYAMGPQLDADDIFELEL